MPANGLHSLHLSLNASHRIFVQRNAMHWPVRGHGSTNQMHSSFIRSVRRLLPIPNPRSDEEQSMRALTVEPGKKDTARVDDVQEPDEAEGPVLVETIAIGVCGTDLEITSGHYGWAPPGRDRLI